MSADGRIRKKIVEDASAGAFSIAFLLHLLFAANKEARKLSSIHGDRDYTGRDVLGGARELQGVARLFSSTCVPTPSQTLPPPPCTLLSTHTHRETPTHGFVSHCHVQESRGGGGEGETTRRTGHPPHGGGAEGRACTHEPQTRAHGYSQCRAASPEPKGGQKKTQLHSATGGRADEQGQSRKGGSPSPSTEGEKKRERIRRNNGTGSDKKEEREKERENQAAQ
ncbi:hypothetical protein C0Q70_19291 [Pomacea canaliculata]|uniref:Uncharacterized protein n=1 Tax=Pomacea canaliculata TaxID=400727 RepID=A0A2T7NIZ6_POMCA|nr:hypothetical protein C0Q70_19291 [Pomacea canaliculata]